MGRDHGADGLFRAPRARDVHGEPAGDRRLTDRRPEHDLVHVDEMLPEALDVDLGPVGGGIGLEDPDDLCDGTEGVLPGHCGCAPGHCTHRSLLMRLAGSRGGWVLSEDYVREHHASKCDAEHDDHDCSPHDSPLSEWISQQYGEPVRAKSMT